MSPSSSHGASAPQRGFAVRLSASQVVASSNTVSFDTAYYDTSAFFNLTTHIATIPAGLGGLYLVTLSLELQLSGTTTGEVHCAIETSGNAANMYAGVSGFPSTVANQFGYGGCGCVAQYAAGDTLVCKYFGAGATITGGANGAVLSAARLGDAP